MAAIPTRPGWTRQRRCCASSWRIPKPVEHPARTAGEASNHTCATTVTPCRTVGFGVFLRSMNSQPLQEYRLLLEAHGPAGLAFLNARVPHRYTGVFRLREGALH